MNPNQFYRLSLISITAIFSGALILAGPIGCSSSVKKVDFEASVIPNDEASRLDEDVKTGFAHHYDLLDNKDFTSAQSELEQAKKQMSTGTSSEKILSTLGLSRAYLNKAKERTESLEERVRGILDARSAALEAGVRRYPALTAAFKNQDDEMRSEVTNIDKGKTTPERWAALQRGYLDLELRSIQFAKLSEPKAEIYGAIKNGAKKNTPNMLAQAERDVKNAENMIATNRHVEAAFRDSVEKSIASAQMLVDVLAATKRPEGVINEDAARALVLSSRKISVLNEKLGEAETETGEKSEQLAEQTQRLKTAGATLTLDKALESARKEFSPEEADVYRQGDKLLIRLKAVNFPSGRADLPPKALPLLAKVKNIAADLNPSQIVIEGHTDSTGKAQTNKALSQDRAEAVATYLGTNGIEKDKIEAVGRGFEKPITSNKTKEGRAQNRRVDVIIFPARSQSM